MTSRPPDKRPPIFGVIAEFAGPDDLLRAIRKARGSGYHAMEAYTPYPIEEVAEALEYKNRLPLLVLLGGIIGGVGGFAMQYWMSVISYPVNVGGRPLNSWPAFIIVSFEMAVLVAAISAVLGMFALNKLPQPYHPVFNVPLFSLASRNRFFLLILSRDPVFDRQATREFLETLDSISTAEVPH